MKQYAEVIVRLKGLKREPDDCPMLVGVVVRVPALDNYGAMLDAAAAIAKPLMPVAPAEMVCIEAMLGGVWHAEAGDDNDEGQEGDGRD